MSNKIQYAIVRIVGGVGTAPLWASSYEEALRMASDLVYQADHVVVLQSTDTVKLKRLDPEIVVEQHT
jgi:hypothetical protein